MARLGTDQAGEVKRPFGQNQREKGILYFYFFLLFFFLSIGNIPFEPFDLNNGIVDIICRYRFYISIE